MKVRNLVTALVVSLCASSAAAQQFQISHSAAVGNPKDTASLKFAELVKERTDGRITVDVGTSSQFGDDAESITNIRLGTIAFSANAQGATSGAVPEIGLLGLPFLFQSLEQAETVMDGPVGDKIAAAAEKQGILVLAWWNNGIRETSNSSKPILAPGDLAGLKIRTPPDPMTIDIFEALGASPTPMAFSELYIALQQKVVDGQENPLINIYSSKLYEVQPYISRTNHKFESTPFLASKIVFDSLSPEDQDIIRKAAVEAGELNRKMVREQSEELYAKLKEAGVTFNDVDPAPFISATQPVYEKWRAQYPELVDELVAAARQAAAQ
ncbi:C4-dicarboxylate ABC transporter [Shinella sumterensis]|uniref:TRAP transporter substrate-binding protein n=1 Tax=Shinella sumterensis TaxID=1967501 RepID=UPI00106E371D|nr:TRAP transporter substrate-binding protein [Shinella sumterensis]MCD1265836.1 DctP family TRAP transporter solute-binding subunit [Shinella sumterensis]TFE97427.1 C4-dicarboxylate ABC transporter [Shinella sumterensis]